METLETIVAAHPFLDGMNVHYLPYFTESAALMRYAADQPIFREGAEADHFYLIHKGKVALETFVPGRGMTTIQTLEDGDALGWSWLFPPHVWHFSARAVEPVELVAFGARHLRAKARDMPEFGYEISMRVGRVMLSRLQATRLRLLDFYGVRG